MINLLCSGNLSITKTVLGVYDNNKVETIVDDDTEFSFNIKLTAKSGYESFIEGTKVFGDYIFIDGVGKVKVRAGETVTIPDIPIGTSYKVTEENMPEYQVQGYPIFTGTYGTISNNTYKINVNNFIDKRTSAITPVEEKTTSFTVTKKVTGNYEIEQDYDFEISLSGLKENTTYTLSNETSFTSDSTGCANVSVSLKNNDSITVQNIPVGSKYKVYEHAGDYISSYVITDSKNLGSIKNSADNNTKTNIALSTATETADEGEDITITFTNDKKVVQNLKLAKMVTDENDKNSYIFKIEFANMKNGTSFNSSFGKVTADSTGKAETTLYLAGGDEAEIYNIPVGTTYKVTELASSSIASYKVTDENGMDKIVSATGANTQSKTALSTAEETVNEGEEVTVLFINDTINQEPDSVTASFGITKDVLDMKGKKLENCEDTFTFELTPDNETNPMPENSSITITGNGEESFDTITFSQTGTYSYKVTEKVGDLKHYSYDNSIYTIVYDVTNTEGLLDITKTVKKDGFNSDVIAFTNRISMADVKILKTDEKENSLSGASLQILDANGNIVEDWITSEDKEELKLSPGTYTLHESKAPKGYEVADDIIFVVNEDGTINVNDEEVDIVTMVDSKIKVEQNIPNDNEEDKSDNDNSNEEDRPNNNNEEDITNNNSNTDEKNRPNNDNINEDKEQSKSSNESENLDEPKNNVLQNSSTEKNLPTGDKIAIYSLIFILSIVILIIVIKKKYHK